MRVNKKLVLSLIAAGILTTGTALANPFDDVPKGHWAYDAVQKLADAGIADGYNDNTFRGDRPMTRYEMAQVVGRAISHEKMANQEQKALIDKLSAEYSEELNSLGIRVNNLEKQTAGVKDLKISHWFQTENTYGNTTAKANDSMHEYELEYRMTFEKQISDKLSILHQLETKTYWDDFSAQNNNNFGRAYNNGNQESVFTRLAYVTYKPDTKNTLNFGKEAVWLAGGFLGDDYLRAVDYTTKLDDKTSLQMIHGRYETNANWPGLQATVDAGGNVNFSRSTQDTQINYVAINSKLGTVDVGAHYLTGNHALASNKETKILAVTAGANLGDSGVNLSGGFGRNSEADKDNEMYKLQLYKKLNKTDVFLQYWKQEANIDLPIENGNHTTFWGDEYNNFGHKGYRLILGHPVSTNCYAEAWYGDYKNLKSDEKGQKFGWDLTFSY